MKVAQDFRDHGVGDDGLEDIKMTAFAVGLLVKNAILENEPPSIGGVPSIWEVVWDTFASSKEAFDGRDCCIVVLSFA